MTPLGGVHELERLADMLGRFSDFLRGGADVLELYQARLGEQLTGGHLRTLADQVDAGAPIVPQAAANTLQRLTEQLRTYERQCNDFDQAERARRWS